MNTDSQPESYPVTQDEANEQQMMPYDQNLEKLREGQGVGKKLGSELSDAPMDENFVNDDIIEEGQHTT